MTIINVFNTMLDAVFPRCCLLCNNYSERDCCLCSHCETSLPRLIEPTCKLCAIPLAMGIQENSSDQKPPVCGQCLQKPIGASQTTACFYYKPPISDLITGLKFNHQLPYGQLLGHLMAQQIKTRYQHETVIPNAIIPMPLHRNRLRKRGFNQACVLAKPIKQTLGIPIRYNAVKRQYDTASQSSLSAQKREKNMWHAFTCSQPLDTDCVAVVDDVMTTASTVRSLCNTLLSEGGVKEIHVWCCARATL